MLKKSANMKALKGALKGMSKTDLREKKDRL